MQGTNETQPLDLVLFAVPSASGWGAGLPLIDATRAACLPLPWCGACAGAGARVGWVLALPLTNATSAGRCPPVQASPASNP